MSATSPTLSFIPVPARRTHYRSWTAAPGQLWSSPYPCNYQLAQKVEEAVRFYCHNPRRRRYRARLDLMELPWLHPVEAEAPLEGQVRSYMELRPRNAEKRCDRELEAVLVSWWRRPLAPGEEASFQCHAAVSGYRIKPALWADLDYYRLPEERPAPLARHLFHYTLRMDYLEDLLIEVTGRPPRPDAFLIEAILANPLDLLSWQAWRDWLLENATLRMDGCYHYDTTPDCAQQGPREGYLQQVLVRVGLLLEGQALPPNP